MILPTLFLFSTLGETHVFFFPLTYRYVKRFLRYLQIWQSVCYTTADFKNSLTILKCGVPCCGLCRICVAYYFIYMLSFICLSVFFCSCCCLSFFYLQLLIIGVFNYNNLQIITNNNKKILINESVCTQGLKLSTK